jgi:hypothetical protein
MLWKWLACRQERDDAAECQGCRDILFLLELVPDVVLVGGKHVNEAIG